MDNLLAEPFWIGFGESEKNRQAPMFGSQIGQVSRDIAGMQQGDEEAVARLWRLCYQASVGHARKVLAGIPDRVVSSEDVAASAFVSVWKDVTQKHHDELLRSADLWRFLMNSVNQKAVDHRRRANAKRRGAGKVFVESELDAAEPNSLDQLGRTSYDPHFEGEVVETVHRFFASLPENLRGIASMKLSLGLSNAEIASALNLTIRDVQRKVAKLSKHAVEFGQSDNDVLGSMGDTGG